MILVFDSEIPTSSITKSVLEFYSVFVYQAQWHNWRQSGRFKTRASLV